MENRCCLIRISCIRNNSFLLLGWCCFGFCLCLCFGFSLGLCFCFGLGGSFSVCISLSLCFLGRSWLFLFNWWRRWSFFYCFSLWCWLFWCWLFRSRFLWCSLLLWCGFWFWSFNNFFCWSLFCRWCFLLSWCFFSGSSLTFGCGSFLLCRSLFSRCFRWCFFSLCSCLFLWSFGILLFISNLCSGFFHRSFIFISHFSFLHLS